MQRSWDKEEPGLGKGQKGEQCAWRTESKLINWERESSRSFQELNVEVSASHGKMLQFCAKWNRRPWWVLNKGWDRIWLDGLWKTLDCMTERAKGPRLLRTNSQISPNKKWWRPDERFRDASGEKWMELEIVLIRLTEWPCRVGKEGSWGWLLNLCLELDGWWHHWLLWSSKARAGAARKDHCSAQAVLDVTDL